MLGIILTPTYMLAGFQQEDQGQYLTFQKVDEPFLATNTPITTLAERLPELVELVRSQPWFDGSEEKPFPMAIATSLEVDLAELKLKMQRRLDEVGAKDLRWALVDTIYWPFVMADRKHGLQAGEKALVLDALGPVVQWVELDKRSGVTFPNPEEVGAKGLFLDERFSRRKLNGFGAEFGREQILSTLMQEFQQAGISLDASAQTDLAKQLAKEELPQVYHLSREQGKVQLHAEATFSVAELDELKLGNYQALQDQFQAQRLRAQGIRQVWLLGDFLRQPKLLQFLRKGCGLQDLLMRLEPTAKEDGVAVVLSGMGQRVNQVLTAEAAKAEADARKRAEAEKRQAIAAELKIKDERDRLLQEIKRTCTDPSEQSAYEAQFVSRGEVLGIPDLVIKWNINEALSRVELEKEGKQMGVHATAPPPPEPVAPPPAETPAKIQDVAATPDPQESAPESEPAAEPNAAEEKASPAPDEQSEGKPEPVLVGQNQDTSGTRAAKQAAVEPLRPSRKRDKVSLKDIFIWRGELKDGEFISRKAAFHQDNELKVVRLLDDRGRDNAEAMARFRRAYEKERQYFPDISELSEAREGMYYYRKHIERQTLQQYAEAHGLVNKAALEDLGTSEVKFILMVLKAVEELPVQHGGLTAENILVLSKRRWNLAIDLEIKFVDFRSEEVSAETSIEQAHAAISGLIGEEIYREFREKFDF